MCDTPQTKESRLTARPLVDVPTHIHDINGLTPNLPPESDARIIELTNMTPSDLRSALGRIGSDESAEIAAFFATSQMKDIVFGADLTEDERTQARTLMYVFEHTFAIPGVVKTLRGIEFSLKSTVGEPDTPQTGRQTP